MVKLHIRAVFMVRVILWRETAFVCIVTSQPQPCGISEAGGFVIINPDRGGGFTSTGIPGESHCLNVSVFGSSDPVERSDAGGSTEAAGCFSSRRRWFYTADHPWGEPLLECLCHQKGRWFYDRIVQNAALYALKEHPSHPWGEKQPLSMCSIFWSACCAF